MGQPGRLAAAPHTQGPASSPAHFVLPTLAQTSGGVTLHSHWADITVTPGTGDTLTLALDARYHLRNDNKEDAVSELRIDLPQAGAIALSSDGTALTLQPAGDNAYTTSLPVPADGEVDLALTYAADVTAGLLPATPVSFGAA